jgi:hypothetical protein
VVAALAATAFTACSVGEATIEYTLSDDGTYYIVSGVSGSKNALFSVDIPEVYGEETPLPVKEIADEAFRDCTSVSSVSLPEGLEKIGYLAFKSCRMSKIELPSTLTYIGPSAFGLCTYLTEVTIPESVTYIGPKAFKYCSSLEKVYVKANIADLYGEIFANSVAISGTDVLTDTKLTEVYLSSHITSMDISVLYGNAITDIYFEGDEAWWQTFEVYEMTYTTEEDENGEQKSVSTKTVLDKEETFQNIALHYNQKF